MSYVSLWNRRQSSRRQLKRWLEAENFLLSRGKFGNPLIRARPDHREDQILDLGSDLWVLDLSWVTAVVDTNGVHIAKLSQYLILISSRVPPPPALNNSVNCWI